jgi:hypothetical protein
MQVEIGRLLTSMFFIVVPIISIIIYISIASQVKPVECKEFISGQTLRVLGDFENCIKSCWSKHNFGQDIYSDDCFISRVLSNSTLERETIESFLNITIPVKVYFDFIESNVEYRVKFRYNSTSPEMSLVLLKE